MDPAFLGPLVPIAAIIAFAAVKIARLRAIPPASTSADITARVEALEHDVRSSNRSSRRPRNGSISQSVY